MRGGNTAIPQWRREERDRKKGKRGKTVLITKF